MANHNYDTAQIRSQAKHIERCKKQLSAAALSVVRSIRSSLDGSVEGKMADALRMDLRKVQDQLSDLSSALNALYSGLMRYADALEEADARVAKEMSGH